MAATAAAALLAQQALAHNVGVIDIDIAIQRTAYFQEQTQILQAREDYSELVQEAESLQGDLKGMEERIRREADTLTEAEVARLRRESEEMLQEYQLVGRRIQQRQQEFLSQVVAELQEDVQTVVAEIYKTRELRVLLNRQGVIIADPAVDITEDVIRAVDRLRNDKKDE